MKKLVSGKFILLFNIVLSLCFLMGCDDSLNIKVAQAFGATSENFEQSYQSIVVDIYDSCLRNARYKIPIQDRKELENGCTVFAYYQDRLLKSHAVLARYTKAFRDISSDKLIEDLDGAAKLANVLASLPIPQLQEASLIFPIQEVVGSLASAIEKAIADQERRDALKHAIKKVNADLQLYIATLSRVTESIYGNQLKVEELAMDTYYRQILGKEGILGAESKKPNDNAKVTALLVDKQWQDDKRLSAFPEKYLKLNSYLTTLKDMASKHQELYNVVSRS